MDASALESELARLLERHAERPTGRSFAPLADCYRKLGQPRAALPLLLSGLDRHPNYYAARVILGKVYQDLGDVVAARNAYQLVLESDPYNLVARRQVAILAEAERDWPAALSHWEHLQSADPTAADLEVAVARVRQAIAASAQLKDPVFTSSVKVSAEPSPRILPPTRRATPTAAILEARLEPDPEPQAKQPAQPEPAATLTPTPIGGATPADGIVTATLARIYREQGFASKALEIYEELSRVHADPAYAQAARELRDELSRMAAQAAPNSGDDLVASSLTSAGLPRQAHTTHATHATQATRATQTAPAPPVVEPVSAPSAPSAEGPTENDTDFVRFRKWLDRNKVRS